MSRREAPAVAWSVPPSVTLDELHQLVNQAIWE
eukprot:CAMPEP_0172625798 /NCGR_PEP_ID=MMETSP1068-20121228/145910_1 /TAXON_ID=35684 /ORGANISM="Pseudopedinella elastica, Strain CCMP716" /LENGTH=32 /DNA_ID= /DNA_START= /DNA_END= /DNA_ORIENTATION=